MSLPFLPTSSLARKYWMAVTGFLLIVFVLVHMAGNLLIYAGPDSLNSYAHNLKANPLIVWAARTGLLLVFLVHLYLGLSLTAENQAARPIGYVYEDTLRASWASRHMLLTGLVLLAFILYHLAHYTLGVVQKAEVQVASNEKVVKNYLDLSEVKDPGAGKYVPRPQLDLRQLNPEQYDARQDVYRMVVSGFSNWLVSLSYIVAMVFLWLHLWHGGSSWFQSLGINHPRYNRFFGLFGPVLATLVLVGNCSIPLAVLCGVVR
jgi:succinate dehydrogenase / fumarate reductase cytochrome b subunit